MKRENAFNLEKYIQELLYRYDLIIIPGFGAIIGRRKSAKYNPKTFLFSPPYKDISFNSTLKESDGLLVNYVAGKLNISHLEASKKIDDEVQKWKKQLHDHKRLMLENIGIFSSVNDKIIFQALLNKNFLPDSYGLTSFIKKKSPQTTIHMSQQDKSQDQKFEDIINQTDNKYTIKPYLKYAALFVVGIGLLGGGLFVYNRSQEAGPFQKATFMVEKELPPVKVTDTSSLENEYVEEQSKVDENTDSYNNENSTSSTTMEEKEDLAAYKYQIIVGGFLHKKNAERKIKSFEEMGYQAQIIGQNKRGLYVVAVKGGNDLESLKQKLPEIKQFEPEAWIHKSK